MKSALKIIIDAFPVDSEAFRKFLTLVGEWWRETAGGTQPIANPDVESDNDEEYANARFKSDLKRWGCPIRLLPAVRKFRIELGREDKLFSAFGSKRKEAGKLKFEVYSPNIHINRYIWHQVDRLYACKLTGDSDKFWKIGKQLLRSRAYQVCALNHVLSGWHTYHAYGFIKKVFKDVNRLCHRWPSQADLDRAYIPKASGGWRPLGVPSHQWRIYSHMWQNLLTMFLSDTISDSQHGFLPGKGVLTAWREIMAKAIKADYIWEYDLKNFFGEIKIEMIHQYLLAVGVPKPIAAELRKINRSITNLQEVDLIPEPERNISYTSDLKANPNLRKAGSEEIKLSEYFGPVLPPKPWTCQFADRIIESPEVIELYEPTPMFESQSESFQDLINELRGIYFKWKRLYKVKGNQLTGSNLQLAERGFMNADPYPARQLALGNGRGLLWERINETIEKLEKAEAAFSGKYAPYEDSYYRVLSGGRMLLPQPDPTDPPKPATPDRINVVISSLDEEDDFIILEKGVLTRDGNNWVLSMENVRLFENAIPEEAKVHVHKFLENRTLMFAGLDAAKSFLDLVNAPGEELVFTPEQRKAQEVPPQSPNDFEATLADTTNSPVKLENKTFSNELVMGTSGWKEYGVPQGLATSPILSIFALNWAHTVWDKHTIAYADDFIKFGRFYEEVQIGNMVAFPDQCRWTYHPSSGEWTSRLYGSLPRDHIRPRKEFTQKLLIKEGLGLTRCEQYMKMANIMVNHEKSGPVKLGGTWLRPLKFLGMEYDGLKQTFRASTRKGATLEFDSLRAVQAYLHAQRGQNGLSFPTQGRPGSGHSWDTRSSMETTFQNMGGQAIVKLLADRYHKDTPRPSMVEEYNNLPKDLHKIIVEGKIRWPWERLFKSQAYGYFMSRMQSDTWLNDIVQDFNYEFTPKSWAGIRGPQFGEYHKLGRIDIFNSSSFAPMCLLMDLDYKRKLVRRTWSDKNTRIRTSPKPRRTPTKK